jgi:hypothetical protein
MASIKTVKKTEGSAMLEISPLSTTNATFCIKGTSPMIQNRLAEKARQQLLLPPAKKNSAERAQSLKHDPVAEYRSSVHRMQEVDAPTLLAIPATAFKGAMRSAALELPGTTKSQIGRLTYIREPLICVYGVPQLLCSVTRMADPGKTPDIRTRAILPEWVAVVTITFVQPQLNANAVGNLISAAGQVMGVGDWRPEKGSGSYGQFEICSADDKDFRRIVKDGGRDTQIAALADPVAYNEETAELLEWFNVELRRRGFKTAA